MTLPTLSREIGVVKRKDVLVRQAKFREDLSVTDVPAKDSENPQLEKQSELFQFGKDQKNLNRLNGVNEPKIL